MHAIVVSKKMNQYTFNKIKNQLTFISKIMKNNLSKANLQTNDTNKIWAALIHLSFNMWEEFVSPHRPFRGYRPELNISQALWDDAINRMKNAGLNMVVIDLGDAVKYETHPEIAVKNAWSTDQLRTEVKRLKNLGLEPIPKLNFSAGHNTWMKDYSRMVSTNVYYQFCKNLIGEVVDIFDQPRFFHLGMDEETVEHQHYYRHTTVRKNHIWWGDFYQLIAEVEKLNVRSWIWSDYMWEHPDLFFKNMPKSVLQSNWYYGESFEMGKDREIDVVQLKNNPQAAAIIRDSNRAFSYIELEQHGYDQIPTGSFHNNNTLSIGNTVKYCKEHLTDKRLLGFLQTYWKPTLEEFRELILKGTDLMGEAKLWYQSNNVKS